MQIRRQRRKMMVETFYDYDEGLIPMSQENRDREKASIAADLAKGRQPKKQKERQ